MLVLVSQGKPAFMRLPAPSTQEAGIEATKLNDGTNFFMNPDMVVVELLPVRGAWWIVDLMHAYVISHVTVTPIKRTSEFV